MRLLTEARDWAEAMAAVVACPDLGLALIDLQMPGEKDGLTTLAELLRTSPGLPMLVLSASENVKGALGDDLAHIKSGQPHSNGYRGRASRTRLQLLRRRVSLQIFSAMGSRFSHGSKSLG